MLAAAVAANAQGVINFSSASSGVNARFATSPLSSGGSNLLANVDTAFRADLFWAAGTTTVGVDAGSLSGAGFNQLFSSVAAQRGFFSGGSKTIDGAAPGAQIVAQVRVWDTSFGTFAAAQQAAGAQWFASGLFLITPALTPPNTPPNLIGLGSGVVYTLNYNAVVPEPSSMALAGLGAASLLIFRRRK